jgi:pimeloyl-ACP methyl ester carboxylesterase
MEQIFQQLAIESFSDSQVRTLHGFQRESRVRANSGRESVAVGGNVCLRLVDCDGVLQWEERLAGTLPSMRQQMRGQFGSDRADALEFEFKRLAPSQITSFLAKQDQRLTPRRGLARLNPETRTWTKATLPETGRALLLIHGTFSNCDNMLDGFASRSTSKTEPVWLDQALKAYDGHVYAFDHPTLSVGPMFNAMDLQREVAGSAAKIDLVCHSRGGLVARWWCEVFDPNSERCGKVVIAGGPLEGTGLASPAHLRETLNCLTQISAAITTATGLVGMAVPMFGVVQAVLKVVTSLTGLASRSPVIDAVVAMIPGLFAMSRVGNNPELLRLLEMGSPSTERYHAIISDFQSNEPAWKFWNLYRVLDAGADAVFQGANDLVVDTTSMVQLGHQQQIAEERTLDFGTNDQVHHLNYFSQPQTQAFLADMLW